MTMKRRPYAFTVAACLLLAAGCAGSGAQQKQPIGVPQRAQACEKGARRPLSSDLLNELSLLATNGPADEKRIASIKTDEDLDRYLQELVDDPRFAEEVAPQILIPNLLEKAGTFMFNQRLAVDKSSGKEIYFLPMKGKCTAKEAVDVHPWWALKTTVKVCPKSYQPTHLRIEETKLYCGVSMTEPYCGCGPNLAFCAKNRSHYGEMLVSVKKELTSIVAHAVKSNAAIDQVFVANESERDRNAEFIYRRWRISSGEPADKVLAKLDEWPTSPVLAPRHESVPGQHAGVLTSAGTLDLEAGIRGRMKWFYDAMWCDEPPAGGVTTDAVLALKGNNLREGSDWEVLASKPICTECHARLDYGLQFFGGYGILFAFNPKEHLAGKGPLYGANIKDPRGEATLDPRSFAELAVKQREFSACMVKKVKRHVADDPWDTVNDGALDEAFGERHSLKSLMRAALRRHADDRRAKSCEDGAGHEEMKTVEAGLEAHCSTCHGPQRAPNFSAMTDPKALMPALDALAFGTMPKAPMSTKDRRKLVELLIQRIWKDEPSRAQARTYFLESPAAHVHAVPGLLRAIEGHAGAKAPDQFSEVPEGTMREDLLRYSAGVEAIIDLQALAACMAAGHQGDALEACLVKATDTRNTTRAPKQD